MAKRNKASKAAALRPQVDSRCQFPRGVLCTRSPRNGATGCVILQRLFSFKSGSERKQSAGHANQVRIWTSLTSHDVATSIVAHKAAEALSFSCLLCSFPSPFRGAAWTALLLHACSDRPSSDGNVLVYRLHARCIRDWKQRCG